MKIKIKVRPNQEVRFPGICVHCTQPATEKMELRRRNGRITRWINVPLCTDCAHQFRRQSGAEERLQKIAWLVTIATALLALAIALLLTPPGLDVLLRLLVAGAAAAVVAEASILLFRRAQRGAALPEKRAIRETAVIDSFSWRATTFEFNNETFAEQFRDLNRKFLMEV